MNWAKRLDDRLGGLPQDRISIHDNDEAVTIGALRTALRRASAAFSAYGIGPGDVVLLQLPRGLGLIAAHLGLLAIGAATLPVHPDATPRELEHFCRDAGVKLAILLCEPATPLPCVTTLTAESWRSTWHSATPLGDLPALPEDPTAAILYTSGTTGAPKGACIQHSHLAATVEALHQAWQWQDSDVLLHVLPLFHVHGLFVGLHGALFAGATTVLRPKFDPQDWFASAKRFACTVIMGVPTHYHRILAFETPDTLPNVRLFTSGSAALSIADFNAFHQRFGRAIVERYGMTEIGIVLSNPIDGRARVGSVGLPLPGVEARVVDPDDIEVSNGTVGELLIRGPSVFGGYLRRPEATEQALRGGWMHTGDLAIREEDGFITLVGRAAELVISGGYNVYPAEIEAVLQAVEGVDLVACIGLPDPDLGERVAAVYVGDASESALRAAAVSELSPYKRPRVYVRWTDLPKTALGKVQRKAVRRALCTPVIRPARPEDLDAIVTRNVQMALETEALNLDVPTVTRGVAAALSGQVGANYYIAMIAGQPMGQLMITREWSDWRDAQIWWIQSVYVAPQARKLGVYRALLDHVRTEATQAGAAGIRLYVDRRNTPAAEVYRRTGMDGEHYAVFELMFDAHTEPPV